LHHLPTRRSSDMFSHIKNAMIAAIMAGVIIAPVFGLQIVRSGQQTHLQPEWDMVLIGMAIVFVFQAFVRPAFNRVMSRGERKFTMPVLNDTARRAMIF